MTAFLLHHGSYLALTLALVLTGCGLPVPEEVPIVAAGVLASHGRLDPWLAFLFCLAGAVVGDSIIYAIGHRLGRGVLRKRPVWVRFVTPKREAKIEALIQRHGLKVLFVSRFLVFLRAPVYLTAGILRVPFGRFLLMDVCCATVVVGSFFLLSYAYGQAIARWIRDAEILLTATAVLVVAGAIVYFWSRYRRRARRGQPEAPERVPPPEKSQGDEDRAATTFERVPPPVEGRGELRGPVAEDIEQPV